MHAVQVPESCGCACYFLVLGDIWNGFNYLFFLPPLFCKRSPAFWTQSLGKNRLISAKISQASAKLRPKFDSKSTKSQLKSTIWGLFISQLSWWERTPKVHHKHDRQENAKKQVREFFACICLGNLLPYRKRPKGTLPKGTGWKSKF